MLTKLNVYRSSLDASVLAKARHVLMVLPKSNDLPDVETIPGGERLPIVLARRTMAIADLLKSPVVTESETGVMTCWLMLDGSTSRFAQMDLLRRGWGLLLDEQPEKLALGAVGEADFCAQSLALAAYVAGVNAVILPSWKTGKPARKVKTLYVYGTAEPALRYAWAVAGGNVLARNLIATPGNLLTPGIYRARIEGLATQYGWKMETYDQKALRKLKAGAFLAVAQGSMDKDAAIVHLRRHVNAKNTVALVGKGICFDTGGHNLKSAKYMQGMHEDMAGSAVALGILQAATELDLPVNLDVWLAIAQNHLSPEAYKPGDVVTAMNGTTIEIVHTDAEGRMALADTLALAAQQKPDMMVDFATLTGSMVTSLGTRYSGVFGNRPAEVSKAIAAGAVSGERLCAFPMDDDYAPALDSHVADIKQCLLEGEADHILASCFLQRFVADIPWLHLDLSAANCAKGLGAVSSDITGFGVAWGVQWLSDAIVPM